MDVGVHQAIIEFVAQGPPLFFCWCTVLLNRSCKFQNAFVTRTGQTRYKSKRAMINRRPISAILSMYQHMLVCKSNDSWILRNIHYATTFQISLFVLLLVGRNGTAFTSLSERKKSRVLDRNSRMEVSQERRRSWTMPRARHLAKKRCLLWAVDYVVARREKEFQP